MRKWKSICIEYKKYEQLHKEKIMLLALQMQIRCNKNSTRLKFMRKACKDYCMKHFPAAYKQMEEADWADVAKRMSAMWQKEKVDNSIFEKQRKLYPAFFYNGKVKDNAVKLPFDVWEGVDADIPESTVEQPDKFVEVQTKIQFEPPSDSKQEQIKKLLSIYDVASLTTKEGTVIQFN
tara:strand:+ start:7775 stop:8308 length:534 start_codon:yes stop_codon:yes gene_type:complete